jgi:glycosyltransferase involved in cell wall biosynthesis
MNVHNINIANLSYIPQHAESEYLKISESIDNKVFDFVFLGNIGIAQDIECIINATRIINKNLNFKVHFVGDGSFLKQAKQLVKDYDLLDYVVFHGRHPIEDMPRYYKLADACLITLKGDNLIGSTVPSKLQGYMAAGRPVLGAINGAAQDIIIESGCGVCVNAGEYKSLAREMEQFILNQTSIKDLGRKGRRYFEQHFSLEKYIESIFLDFLKILEVNEDV